MKKVYQIHYFVLFLSIFCTTEFSFSAQSSRCATIFTAQGLDSWASLKTTSAQSFQTDHPYIILIHGITSSTSLLKNPSAIAYTRAVSVSLVSQKKPQTFANSGLVIEAQDSNVEVASSVDMFIAQKDPKSIEEAKALHGRKSPSQILEETGSTLWNEIILVGENRPSLKAVGYFVVISANGHPLVTSTRFQMIQNLSVQNKLPIFLIRNPNRNHVHDGIEWD